MKKTAKRYGLIAGGIMAGALLLSWPFVLGGKKNYEMGEVIGYTSMVLGLLAVFFGIMHQRDRVNGGTISFGEALKLGVLISLIAAAIFMVVDTLYVLVLDPDFMCSYAAYELDKLKAGGATEAQIKQYQDQVSMMAGPGGMVILEVVMFLTVFLIGLGISLISALILKRDEAAAVRTSTLQNP